MVGDGRGITTEDLIVLALYGAIGAILLVLAIVFYSRSVASRKRYCCPKCGEQISVELMSAGHCNVCGTPLRNEMHGGRP